MKITKQKDAFLAFEGDNWYARNKEQLTNLSIDSDFLLQEVLQFCPNNSSNQLQVLEIGCGNGKRLAALQSLGYLVHGIEPSQAATEAAKANGVNAIVGTADELPYSAEKFDVLIFGFCLYLCDREDLFKIAYEADRVLKSGGYIFILDFYSKNNVVNEYHHLAGVKSYKMDYSKLFDWHPNYLTVKQQIGSHEGFTQTLDEHEWISISVIRKIGE